MTENEAKVAVLEALREEHDKRHDRFEADLKGELKYIKRRLDEGEKHFSKLDSTLSNITGMLREHCDDGHNLHVAFNGMQRARQIIIRMGPPMATGGGIVAIILWALEKFAS